VRFFTSNDVYMKSKNLIFSLLLVAMSLGTAWAIRGQFGHEHGAAWAGALGSLSVLLVSKRKDWLAKALYATLAGALGWGLGGIMSYGLVVGYGRADDFGNALYGLEMLLVIGGLYGFMGGGFFGLALSDTKKNPIKWAPLIVEMTLGGILFYYFLINQYGWKVNPPRSEVWAVCLGVAVALTWNLIRNKNYVALRVAIFSSLGAGFGFAFGNFLQVLGSVSEIHFNFWNVMEYSLGFFGGIGLAYGTLTAEWEPEEQENSVGKKQWFHLLMLVLIIPYIMWQQNFEWERIQSTYVKLLATDDQSVYHLVIYGSLILTLVMGIYWVAKFRKTAAFSFEEVRKFFFGHWLLYILLSYIVTGAIISTYRIEQYLYLINFFIILLLINRANGEFKPAPFSFKKAVKIFGAIILFISLLAFILIQTHGELKGSHKRFGEEPAVKDSIAK